MVENLKITVAKNIASLRTRAKLTQHELGEKINYSDKAVSRWERGDAVPDAYVLLQLAEIFSVSVDYLLSDHPENEALPEPPKKYRFNHRSVTLIAFLGVWTAALLIFVVLFLCGYVYWMAFAYAVPVSLTVLLILHSIWADGKRNMYIISGMIWSILGCLYLSFLNMNIWIIFLLGVPAQIIVFLAFRVKIGKNIL